MIRRAAVIGAGTMGAAIAAHLANAGVQVLLLDLASSEGRVNRLAEEGLARAQKAHPPAFMDATFASRITTGNLQDHLPQLANVDWVIEAVAERLDIKHQLWADIETVLKPGAWISSNSSGIPMFLQVKGRSEAFRRHFVGTHFFNPPRYLHLLEVIPTPDTDPQMLEQLCTFAREKLGKGVVIAKDVPGFIANRIGVYGMVRSMQHMHTFQLSPDVIDALTGPLIGRAKSATFRTADISGLDIISSVANQLNAVTPPDEDFSVPELVLKLVEQGRLGDKSGQGFYHKVKQEGKSVIYPLDPHTLDYLPPSPIDLGELGLLKNSPLPVRIRQIWALDHPYAQFIRTLWLDLIWYASKMLGTVSDDALGIDQALKWGFAWEMGPFELIETLGLETVCAALSEQGYDLPQALAQARTEKKTALYAAPYIIPRDLRQDASRVVRQKAGASLLDMGDGVLLLEFHSKMNALGEDALGLLSYSHQNVQALGFVGLVVGNGGEQFSAGANLAMLLMQAQAGAYQDIDLGVRQFQKATTGLRYSPHPTVVAPFNLVLGGGCEVCLYADHVQAHAESYIGLVEVGVGLIPAAGGSAEMLLRAQQATLVGQPLLPAVQRAFETMMQAKVSSSAHDAKNIGYLRSSDSISMNRDQLLQHAKAQVLHLAPHYQMPIPPQNIPVLGSAGVAAVQMSMYMVQEAGYASPYDAEIAQQLAKVLCGGQLSRGATVSFEQLLDLEREAFLHLIGRKSSQDRIAHMLKTGKPLRN